MEKNETKEIVVATQEKPTAGLIRPVVSAADLIDHHKEVTEIIRRGLEEGRDYGKIPGTSDRPVLLKPGAERLAAAFGCAPTYEVISSEVDHDRRVQWSKRRWNKQSRQYETETGESLGLYRYAVRCRLVHRASGQIAGEGIGSASTMESKYIDRPRDLENTVLKMAQKRALVAAVLNAFGLSDRFTQDLEDFEPAEVAPAAPHTEPLPTKPTNGKSTLRTLYDRARAAGVPDDLWKDTLKTIGITPDKATQTAERLDRLENIVTDWEQAAADKLEV